MVRAFWLVLLDLWDFLWGHDSELLHDTTPIPALTKRSFEPLSLESRREAVKAYITAPSDQVLLQASTSAPDLETSTTDATLRVPLPLPDWPQTPMLYYVATEGAYMLLEPHLDFDSAITRLSLGQVVQVLRFVGRYAEVAVHDHLGFVQKDDIVMHRDMVWPSLIPGTVYDTTHVVTHKIRRLIDDLFIAGHLGLPLQAGEYIVWRQRQDNLNLTWPKIRPRVPGKWHHILRGQPNVHTRIVPEIDSVMEWYAEDGVGRLAYVEAVLPDETIRITGVGIAVAGEYSELVLPAGVWREWRPVFMRVETNLI